MEIFYTVVSGTLVYVLGQLASRFIIEPIQRQREVLGEIVDTLSYHANVFGVYTEKNSVAEAASVAFRSLGTKLMARTHAIPFYGLLERMHITKSRVSIHNIHKDLIGLSNSVYKKENFEFKYVDKRYRELEKNLAIEPIN